MSISINPSANVLFPVLGPTASSPPPAALRYETAPAHDRVQLKVTSPIRHSVQHIRSMAKLDLQGLS